MHLLSSCGPFRRLESSRPGVLAEAGWLRVFSCLWCWSNLWLSLRFVCSGVSAGAIPSSGTFQKNWAGFCVRARRSPGQNTGSMREESTRYDQSPANDSQKNKLDIDRNF